MKTFLKNIKSSYDRETVNISFSTHCQYVCLCKKLNKLIAVKLN